MKISTIDLQYISQLISEIHHLPVSYINVAGEVVFEYSSAEYTSNPSYISLKEQLKTYPYHTASNSYPIFFSIAECNYFYINLTVDNQYLGALVVGPSLSPVIEDTIKSTIYHEPDLFPTLHYQQCLAISLFVYYSIYQKKYLKQL